MNKAIYNFQVNIRLYYVARGAILLKLGIFVLSVCFASPVSYAQLGINANGNFPDNSAMLDVKSSTSGMLIPRMTTAERNSIFQPASGLMVFCIDDSHIYTNKGSSLVPNWVTVSTPWLNNGDNIYFSPGNVGIGTTNPEQLLQVSGNIAAQNGSAASASYVFGDGSENTGFSSPAANHIAFVNNGIQSVRIDEAGRVAIGGGIPDPSAKLDVASTIRGFLPPRMTTVQRDAIASPTEGLLIYNTDEKAINIYKGTGWGPMVATTCGSPFTDTRNGKSYNTILIGTQCWMKENLNLGIRINGSGNQSNNSIYEKYCYSDLESNCDIYGGLYQWAEMVLYLNGATNTTNWSPSPTGNVQGICPTGWHLPSNGEWNTLSNFLGGGAIAGGKMKESGFSHWVSPNTGATNSSGFTGLPGGDRYVGSFVNIGSYAFFWSLTPQATNTAWYTRLDFNNTVSNLFEDARADGFSVKCVKSEE
jgi:uncharacterized protein (TIGR02145 family)